MLDLFQNSLNCKQDTQVWKIVRENKLRTLKDLFSSNQLHPNDYCIPQSQHTFLHEAIVTNRKEIFKLCLLYHADVNKRDKNEWTPLMKACALNRQTMVADLLEKGADPYLKDKKGENCFDKAIKFERINVLNLLNSHCGLNSTEDNQNENQGVIVDENEKL